jgi:hypothetical protein
MMKKKCKFCKTKRLEKDSDGLYPDLCDACKFKGLSLPFGLLVLIALFCNIFFQMIEYSIILIIGIIIVAEWRYLKYQRKPKGFFEIIGWKFWEVIQAFILWWLPAGIIVHIYRNLNYILNGIWWGAINFLPALYGAITQFINGILSVGSILLIIIIVSGLFIAWAYLNAWLVRRGK